YQNLRHSNSIDIQGVRPPASFGLNLGMNSVRFEEGTNLPFLQCPLNRCHHHIVGFLRLLPGDRVGEIVHQLDTTIAATRILEPGAHLVATVADCGRRGQARRAWWMAAAAEPL